jgi:predicted transcriptional regulator
MILGRKRKRKKFQDTIKVKLYSALSSGPLGFTDWMRKSRVDRDTFNDYRAYGLEKEEIDQQQVRGKYQLTSQGRNELERIEYNNRLKNQRKRYNALLTSLNELTPPPERWYLESQVRDFELPLPAAVDVSFYGSEELFPLFEWVEYQLQAHDGVGSRKLTGEFLKQTKHMVEPFLWNHIWERLAYLLRWHGRYELKETKKTPPPLTIENILGFDLSFRIDYKGKELLKQLYRSFTKDSESELHKIGKRLVGTILLRLAYVEEGETDYSSGDLIPLLVKTGLLDRNDAQLVGSVIPRQIVKLDDNGGRTIEEGRFRWKDRTGVVLPIALRYLHEGGILEVPTGSTPEELAKHFLEYRTPIVSDGKRVQ